MSSVYRGSVCPDCGGEGRIAKCPECDGNGIITCDLCGGDGARTVPSGDGGMESVKCVCQKGFFTCGVCSGGTGVCGRCGGSGMIEGK